MITRSVRSGGADLATAIWGTAGASIVALHPGVGDRRIWDRCAPVWADAGHRVVAYDRRGFGETQYVAERHDDLVDLRAVTHATDAVPAVIVGNSRGGGLALDLALEFPDEVVALILLAPSPTGYDESTWPTSAAEAQQDQLIEAAEEAGDVALVNRLEVRYWLDGTEQDEGRVTGPARDLLLEMNGQALRAAPVGEEAERSPAWDRLTEIQVPTLIVAGRHDLPGVGEQCAEMAELLPNAQLATLADSAHCPSLDDPDGLNALVVDFLVSVTT